MKFVEFPDDCRRIQQLFEKSGHIISLWQANKMWLERSKGSGAFWVMLPEDDEQLLEECRGFWTCNYN